MVKGLTTHYDAQQGDGAACVFVGVINPAEQKHYQGCLRAPRTKVKRSKA